MLLTGIMGLEWGRQHQVEIDLAVARAACQTGKLADARRRLQRAIWLAPGASEPRLALAELEIQLGNVTLAERLLVPLSSDDFANSLQARALMVSVQIDLFRGRQAAARQSSSQALSMARATGEPELEARALLVDYSARIEESADVRPALVTLERARTLAADIGHDRLRAEAESEIGHVLWWYLREVDDPVSEYFNPALEVFRRSGDALGEARVLDLISFALMRADDLVAFFKTQEEALKIWERVGNKAQQVEGHLQLGWAWDRLENPRRAHRHLERALELSRETGFDFLMPRIQRYLAAVEHSSGRSERAVARLEDWLAEQQPLDHENRSLFGVLGDAQRRLGDSVAALAAYEQALALDRVKDVSFQVWIGAGQARTALAESDLPRARQLLSKLEDLVGPQSDWSDRRRVLLLRARVLEATSGPASSLATLLEAAEIETRSLGSVGGLTVDHGLGVLKQLLPRLLNPERMGLTVGDGDERNLWAAEAFRLLEQARLRPARQRQLARLGRSPASAVALSREGQALELALQASALAIANSSPENLAQLREAYASYEEETFRARSGGGVSNGGLAGTVAEIQRQLSPKTAVVVYVLVQRIAVALVLRTDRFVVVPLDFRPADLRPRIKILRHQLAAAKGRGWRAPARELGRLLLDPIAEAATLEGSGRLLVVPMGELHEVPFAALLDAAGRPLIDKVAIAVVPAASVLLDSRAAIAGPALVVGRESFRDLGLPDLPAARREAEAIARESNARLVFGSELSEAVFRLMTPDASRLHIVAHARIEPEMPMLSRLILAPPEKAGDTASDGELTVRELLDLELRAELVTLSACRSGLALPASRLANFELRRTGLVEGFLLAGARNVLGTLFPVEDEATAAFMVALEAELRWRQPIDALAAVQRTLAAGSGPTAHPGHWAAFVLAGPGTWSAGRMKHSATVTDPVSVEVK